LGQVRNTHFLSLPAAAAAASAKLSQSVLLITAQLQKSPGSENLGADFVQQKITCLLNLIASTCMPDFAL
jgi:hypothetical protein